MPNISSTDAAIHAAQDLIRALQNPAPCSSLVTLGNTHNEAMISLEKIFDKSTSPAIPLRVVQMKQHQPIVENCPNNHSEHTIVPTVEAYPEELQQVHPVKKLPSKFLTGSPRKSANITN